jgi:hypothetical protein
MDGIQYIVNEKGERTSVLIDLQKHSEIWEDFYDALIVKARADEPRESLEDVRQILIKEGKLDA